MNDQVSKIDSKSIWKWMGIFLFIISIFVGFGVQSRTVHAADTPSDKSSSVTGLGAGDALTQDSNGNWVPVTSAITDNWYKGGGNYSIKYNFKIASGVTINQNDWAIVHLPAGVVSKTDQTAVLWTDDTHTTSVGTFHIDANATTGTIKFSDYFLSHNLNRGGSITMYVDSTQNNDGGGDKTLGKGGNGFGGSGKNNANTDYFMGQKFVPIPIINANGKPATDDDGNPLYRQGYVMWNVLVNKGKISMKNLNITDTLDTSNQTLVLGDDKKPLIQITNQTTGKLVTDFTVNYSQDNPGVFKIHFNQTITDPLTINYVSKITDENYLNNGTQATFYNAVKLDRDSNGSGDTMKHRKPLFN